MRPCYLYNAGQNNIWKIQPYCWINVALPQIKVAHVAWHFHHHHHCHRYRHHHHCHHHFKGHHNSNIYISHCYYLCRMSRVMFSWVLLCDYAISKTSVHIGSEVACVAPQEISLWSVLYPEQPSLVSRKAISLGNGDGNGPLSFVLKIWPLNGNNT